MFKQTYSFDDVSMIPQYSDLKSRSEADISIKIDSNHSYKIPIIMSPMDTVCSLEMIKFFVERRCVPTLHRYFKSAEDQFNFIKPLGDNIYSKVFFAVGSKNKYEDWILYLFDRGINNFCVDMAHGDSKLCLDTIEFIKKFSSIDLIMAGNVCTKGGYKRLYNAGANLIRCGIATGSICSTALQTGFGKSQLTTILDCAKVKGTSFLICDGGIKHNGDFAKAMAAGADFVMCGKYLASTNLACGQSYNKDKTFWLECENKPYYKEYRGMASRKARENVLSYGSVEGVSGLVKYSGTTEQKISDLELNLKASLSYVGARNWNEFRQKVKFSRRSEAGIVESGTHLNIHEE